MTKETTWERIKLAVDGHNSQYDFWLTDSTFNDLLAESKEITTKKGCLILDFDSDILEVCMNNLCIDGCEDVHVRLIALKNYKYLDTILIKKKTVTVL